MNVKMGPTSLEMKGDYEFERHGLNWPHWIQIRNVNGSNLKKNLGISKGLFIDQVGPGPLTNLVYYSGPN